jgi:GntR family transcriptional regulator
MSSTAAAAPRPMLREHMNQFLDRGRSDQRRVLYFGMDRASSLVAEALGLEPGASVLKVVRLRSREGSPLTYTESLVPGRLAHVLDRTALARRALIQALEDGGIRVGGAKQTIRAERCPQAIASLLDIETHEPVLVLERVVFDEADEPVQHLKGWYRADRFEIQLQMSRAEDSARVQVQPRWG